MNPTNEEKELAATQAVIYREWDSNLRARIRTAKRGPAAVHTLYCHLSSAIATQAMQAGITSQQLHFPELR